MATMGRSPLQHRLIASFALLGAGVIHAAQIQSHFREWGPAGVFFATVAALQLLCGASLLFGASKRVVVPSLGLSVVVAGVWAISRTIGIPLGPHAGVAEPLAVADLTALAFEVVTAGALTMVLLRRSRAGVAVSRRRLLIRATAPFAVAASIATMTAFAVVPGRGCEPGYVTAASDERVNLTPLELLQQHDDPDHHRFDLKMDADIDDVARSRIQSASGAHC